MMKTLILCSATLALISLAGCFPQGVGTTKADHQNLCEVSGWRGDVVNKLCKPGQKIAYLPERWGNEQLPIKFAAVNCDLEHNVVWNNGGVTCIYRPITMRDAKTE